MGKIELIKTIRGWIEEYTNERDGYILEQRYGYANYLDGKVNALKEVEILLVEIEMYKIEYQL